MQDGRRPRRRLRRLRPLRAQPVLHLVPNIFTIMGLCAGLTGIRYALDGRFELAVMLIILAGVLDFLDGLAARMLRITSPLGAQLDSLGDFLSFGVAPALLVYLWTLHQVRGAGWALALLFAACCALRLARFNTELDDPNRPRWSVYFFTGIPAPAAAGCMLLPMIAYFAISNTPALGPNAVLADLARSWTLGAALTVFVSLMMVSKVPTLSLKRLRVQPDWVLPTLLGAGLLVAFLASAPWSTLTFLGLVYLLTLPLGWLAAQRMKRREATPTPIEPAAPETGAQEDGERVVSLERPGSEALRGRPQR
jgi:CDP-diacylglycerol---serine O-phosphatidyltransferase